MTYTGPDGETWNFYDYDTLFAHFDDFYWSSYSAQPFTGEFDFSNTFGLFETYTSSFSWFYYYDSDGAICDLSTDFNEEGDIIGFYIYDTFDSCPYVYDGWTYAEATFSSDGLPLSYTGTDGETWFFYTEEQLYYEDDSYYYGIYGAPAFDYNYDSQDVYAFLETYESDQSMFFYYDSEGSTCQFVTDFDSNGNIRGWTISDPWEGFHCDYIQNGWSYSYVTNDEYG